MVVQFGTPLLQIITGEARDAHRLRVRLKVATGTYTLQTNRASFNNFTSNPECLLCGECDETTQHFLLECKALNDAPQPIMLEISYDIKKLCDIVRVEQLNANHVSIVVVYSTLLQVHQSLGLDDIKTLQYRPNANRLVYSLHVERYKRLGLCPKPVKKTKLCKSTNISKITRVGLTLYIELLQCFGLWPYSAVEFEVLLRRRNLQRYSYSTEEGS